MIVKLLQNIAQKSLRIFSYEADIPCATLSCLENGIRIPSILVLKKFAIVMNWSLPKLLDEVEKLIPEEFKNFDI